MKCEQAGCPNETSGYDLHDYCAVCGKNLCEPHMQRGCCGIAPAESGTARDSDDAAMRVEESIARMTPEDYVAVTSDGQCAHCLNKNRVTAQLAWRWICWQCLKAAVTKIEREETVP